VRDVLVDIYTFIKEAADSILYFPFIKCFIIGGFRNLLQLGAMRTFIGNGTLSGVNILKSRRLNFFVDLAVELSVFYCICFQV
jgi:hypothetical protein